MEDEFKNWPYTEWRGINIPQRVAACALFLISDEEAREDALCDYLESPNATIERWLDLVLGSLSDTFEDYPVDVDDVDNLGPGELLVALVQHGADLRKPIGRPSQLMDALRSGLREVI